TSAKEVFAMRKWFCMVGSFVLLLGVPTSGEAQAAPWQWFTVNQLSVASAGSIRARDEQGKQLIGEIPSPRAESLGMNWTLSAELRDASCPSCRFPDFALPGTFYCLGECSDGHWRVSNGTASAEVKPDATFGLQAITLTQDTTKAAVSCDQEYNLFIEQGNLWPFIVPPKGRPTLDVSRLFVQAYQRIEEAVHVAECPDSRALASTLIGVQFFNPWTGQKLNY
ncbi:MAG TPA: hypothetical protein VGX03_31430, partial [Candidatus Binatia bacterium]|nr:hypothetical protein [Candidatus Binatia bacterium]